MTSNQIAYQMLRETRRSNLAREAETSRSNTAREMETHRNNIARLRELIRSNTNTEGIRRAIQLEDARHNRAMEAAKIEDRDLEFHRIRVNSAIRERELDDLRRKYDADRKELARNRRLRRYLGTRDLRLKEKNSKYSNTMRLLEDLDKRDLALRGLEFQRDAAGVRALSDLSKLFSVTTKFLN